MADTLWSDPPIEDIFREHFLIKSKSEFCLIKCLSVDAIAVSKRLLVGVPTNEAKWNNKSTRKAQQWRLTWSCKSFFYLSPKNHIIWVHFEQTKQVADLFAQSKLKNVAIEVLSWARRVQKRSFLQTGQLSGSPKTPTVWGSVFLKIFMIYSYLVGINFPQIPKVGSITVSFLRRFAFQNLILLSLKHHDPTCRVISRCKAF